MQDQIFYIETETFWVSKVETETLDDGIKFWDWDFSLLVFSFETETYEFSLKFWDCDWNFGILVSKLGPQLSLKYGD